MAVNKTDQDFVITDFAFLVDVGEVEGDQSLRAAGVFEH